MLRIDAMNANLQQVLKEVAADTGANVVGFSASQPMADQRIFGVYGPGQPQDVLSQLLDGTGYNVIIVGSRGADAPMQIVLSVQPKGGPPNGTNQPVRDDQDFQAEEPPPYQPPPAVQRRFPPGERPRTPQQIYEEMQQRQQRMREQEQMQMQQQMQPNNPL